MTEAGSADAYYRAVEETFVRRRGAPLLLSPRDWALIGEWREAGIPLRVVLQGIENVFDAFERRAPSGTRSRRINSLSYCRQEVLTLHDLHRTLHAAEAGRPLPGGEGPPPAVLRHLGRLHRSVRAAMASASAAGLDALVGPLAGAAAALKDLRRGLKTGGARPAEAEEALARLDAGLVEAARAALPPAAVAEIGRGIDAALAGRRGRMTAGAWTATRAAHLARALRRHCGLPRLSLFDP